MITIAKPADRILKLWGSPKIMKDEIYRLMLYVFRVDYSNQVLLYNVVTSQLVVLSEEEKAIINALPSSYCAEMDALIEAHYLVPISYDEHAAVVNLRSILNTMRLNKRGKVNHFTILPTTSCNARCYYCFEQGSKIVNMTEEIANNVIEFIISNTENNDRVSITWFGGEPTVASNRITQICEGLTAAGIDYESKIVTNGFLFNREMVEQAKSLWHLVSAQITIDGTEEKYNAIKSYVYDVESPYRRVMSNIGLLLKAKIYVNVRMNFDLDNYEDFEPLANELIEAFGPNEYLNLRAHPINGEYENSNGTLHHAEEAWFSKEVIALNAIADEKGLFLRKRELLSLRHNPCMASGDRAVVITPDGHLVKCPEQYDEAQFVGDVKSGVTEDGLVAQWRALADYKRCHTCFLFPYCAKLQKCKSKDRCYMLEMYSQQLEASIVERYCLVLNGQREGGLA